VSTLARWKGRSNEPGGPKVDDSEHATADRGADLVEQYEEVRSVAVKDRLSKAGLSGALLVSHGMPAWMRGWRACAPATQNLRVPARTAAPSDLVGVLAAMVLANV
jgi:hypothetical protein